MSGFGSLARLGPPLARTVARVMEAQRRAADDQDEEDRRRRAEERQEVRDAAVRSLAQDRAQERADRTRREQELAAHPERHPDYQRYRDAGLDHAKAVLAVRVPALADNFLRPPAERTRSRSGQLGDRIKALRAEGMDLISAVEQARLESGFAPRREAAPRSSSPARPREFETPRGVLKERIATVGQQIDDARSELTGARSGVKPLGRFASPSDSAAVRSASERAGKLQTRLDSLSGVRDRLTSEFMGESPAAGAAPKADTSARDAELQRADERRRRLIKAGADSAEVEQAYRLTVEQIRRRHGG